jgi:SAM-dependent methyltransferase
MLNRILNQVDRIKFEPIIQDMYKELPAMMSRKIPEANIQQAFMVDFIYPKYSKREILCVGSYEDTAYEYLKLKELDITAIDPEENVDLHTYKEHSDKTFGLIFSTSVIEHVEKDEEFISDICDLLSKNGIAVLTMDFNDTYDPKSKATSHKPSVDYRLYTSKDYIRLGKILESKGCIYIDEFIADSPPDFTYENSKYSFATMVFKKVK